MKRLVFFLLPIFVLGLIMSTFGADVPYSFAPDGGHDDRCREITSNGGGDLFNGDIGGNINMEGIQDSDFDGKTLTSIGLYLCAIAAGLNPDFSDISLISIGVFDNAGNPISIFGTIGFDAIPSQGFMNALTPDDAISEIFMTGSYTMQSGDIIGASFSSINHDNYLLDMYQYILPSCMNDGYGCIPNGQLVATGAGGYTFGAALAGDFEFGGAPIQPTQSAIASVILPAAFIIIIVYASFTSEKFTVKEKTSAAIGGVIAIGLIFIVFLAVGL